MDSRMEGALEGMGQRLEGMELRLDGSMTRLQDDMQQFMVIFTRQNQVRMAKNFPPRDRNEPVVHRNRGNRGRANPEIEANPEETLEGVVGNDRNGTPNGQHRGFTVLLMEIPIFERVNPRWWIKKCERVFEWNNIPMRQRVFATYFNKAVYTWF